MSVETSKKTRRFLSNHTHEERISVYFAIAVTMVFIVLGARDLISNTNPNINYGYAAFPIGIINMIGILLAYKKRGKIAVSLLLINLFVFFMYINVTSAGLAFTLALTFLLLGTGACLYTFDSTEIKKVLGIVALGSLVMFVIGFFWPSVRFPAPPILINTLNIGFLVLLLAYVYFGVSQFPSFSLQGKIVVSMVAVSAVALIVVAVVVSLFIGDALTDQVGKNLDTLVQNEALSVGELLAREVDSLETLALNELLISQANMQSNTYKYLDQESIDLRLAEHAATWTDAADDEPVAHTINGLRLVNELNKFKRVFPEFEQLMVTDKYGGVVAATARPDDFYQEDELKLWWIDSYFNGFGGISIGNPFFDSDKEAWLLEISVPIKGIDSDGTNRGGVGVLQAIIRMDALTDLIESAQFGETGEVEILMPDGRFMHVEDGALQIVLADEEEENRVIELDAPYTRSVVHGVPSLLSSAVVHSLKTTPAIDQLNWTVVVHQAELEGLTIVSNLQIAAGALIVLMIFITAGVAAVVGQQLSRPIVDLTAVAEQVSEGDLTAHAEVGSLNEQDEIGTLATVFNEMTDRLQDAIGNLELRVDERTRAIATSSDVGRRLSTILDREHLVEEVVTQVRNAFNYYHVHIYLLDRNENTLVMAGGTGNAGKQMLAGGHQIEIGQGLVGRAALTNTAVLVSDVATEEGWLPNPLLPETKAETAVPISVGERVLGVLDVQQNEVNSLTQDDVDLLISITNQIAIALQNAEYLESTQEQANQEVLSKEINLKIQSTTSVEEAMQIAVRELGRVLNAPKTRIKLKNDLTESTQAKNGNSEQ